MTRIERTAEVVRQELATAAARRDKAMTQVDFMIWAGAVSRLSAELSEMI